MSIGKTGVSIWEGVTLDSLSLMIGEENLFQGPGIEELLIEDISKYRLHDVTDQEEKLSLRLWDLPEVFHRKVKAYTQSAILEQERQDLLSDTIRYNFSNGMQISAREILRHPLQRKVPGHLLPNGKAEVPVFSKWPLLRDTEKEWGSSTLQRVENIMQALVAEIASALNQKQILIYLQSRQRHGPAMTLTSLEFDPSQELDWRVEFFEKDKELHSQFKLVSFRNRELFLFPSFALEPESGSLIVHAWHYEISLLQEELAELAPEVWVTRNSHLQFELQGELSSKIMLKHLRSRRIPVKLEGQTRILEAGQSLTEIRMDDTGEFYLQHTARVPGMRPLERMGFTSKSALFLQTLTQGLSFLLRSEPKEMAARMGSKRDWDLRLLKHLGILQYLFFETLSVHFTGELTDGRAVKKENLFKSLQGKIHQLLTAGNNSVFVREMELEDLCSHSVLACFEEFAKVTFKALKTQESFYSPEGEIILEGVVEREFRIIFELLRAMALATAGECFRRSRTPFLSKISKTDTITDLALTSTRFFFPWDSPSLMNSLEMLQPLISHGYRVFVKDQPLEELKEDEFHVDFILQADADPRSFNWFELNPKFFLRGQEVEADKFLSLGKGGVIEYDGKLYLVPQKQLPSLKRLENFWEKLQGGKLNGSKRKNRDKVYKLPRNQTLELLALRASGVGIRGDEAWKNLCTFYDSLGEQSRKLELSPTTRATLKPYQAVGVQWLQDLYQLRLGGLLADDMGLGKTLQALAFLDYLRSREEMGHVLIVVPSSLVYNWQSEVEKFTPELPITIFNSREMERVSHQMESSSEQRVFITTYGLMLEHEAFLAQYKWNILIFDEAQNLKNITTKRTSAARALNANFKICLTGTPMENHYGEFYSLVDLLVPGSLGKIEDFRRTFVNSDMVMKEEMQNLKLKIRPLMLRRTKKEILDQLPEKQETKISIAFEEKQKEIYRDVALSYNRRVQESMEVQGEARVQLQMLTALLRLRQVCSDPGALPNVRYNRVPPKIETLVESLQEIGESGESALVFTQFLQTLEHTEEVLKRNNIPVFVLHGGIPTRQRQKILADFQSHAGGAVLLMTLKTGGVGLNLTKASYVFHLEPWWNPSVENQATDRVHRLGQTRAVQVFRYIMHESLEEKIEVLKSRKERKFNSLFATVENEDELASGPQYLSKSDFDMLLGI